MRNHKYMLTIAAACAFYAAFATGLPTDGLQAHFRADHVGRVVNSSSVVPTHGSAVACWTTEPGVASPLKLVKDGNVALPNWQTNAFRRADGSCLPAVRFMRNADNSADIASMHLVSSETTTLNLGKDSTWFLVMNNLTANNQRGVFGFRDEGDNRFGAFFLGTGDNQLRLHNNANPGNNGNVRPAIGAANLIDSRGTSNRMTSRVNGSEVVNIYQITSARTASSQFYMGQMADVSTSAAMDIAELAIYNRALNDAEVRIVRNALAARWGLTISDPIWTGASAGFCDDLAGIGSSTTTGDGRIAGAVNTSASAGGLVLSVTSGSIDVMDGYILVAHDGKPAKILWSEADGFLRVMRTWRSESTHSSVPAVTFAFDLAELGIGSATVRLLYRANSASAFVDTGINGVLSGSVSSFTFASGAYKDGEYTLAVDAVADGGTVLPSTSDMTVWFKPEAGLVTDGSGGVVKWENQGSLGSEADVLASSGTVQVVENALANTSGTANYPVLDFGGNSFLKTSEKTDLGRDGFEPPSWFVVFKPDETVENMKDSGLFGHVANDPRFGAFFPSLRGGYTARTYVGNVGAEEILAQMTSASRWHILGMTAKYSSARNQYVAAIDVNAREGFDPSNTCDNIGYKVISEYLKVGHFREDSWGKPFPGKIAEIRIYKRSLNPVERLLVAKELADKYSLSLNNPFLGATHASGSAYASDITAVGYEDRGECGYSSATSGGLSLDLPDWSSGDDKVFYAHNGGSMSWTTSGGITTLARAWYVQSSSTLPAMRFSFLLGGIENGEAYAVYYRADDTAAWVCLPYPALVANGTVSVKIPSGLATGYFTVGKVGAGEAAVMPCAAVSDGLAGWYRADTGVTEENGSVSVWRNLGLLGAIADVTKSAGEGSVTLSTSVFSEGAVNFGGSAYLKTMGDVKWTSSNDNTWFAVLKVQDGVTPVDMGVAGNLDGNVRFGAFFTGSSDLRMYGFAVNYEGAYCVINNANMNFTQAMLMDLTRKGNVAVACLDGLYQTGKNQLIANANSSAFMIGQMANLTSKFKGDIAEVRVYNRTLSDVERNIVANHLAARYGVTMAGNSLYNGVTAGCTLDVVGIGRTMSSASSESGVHVPGNITVSDNSAGLTIAASGSLSDGDYVLAGHGEKANRWIYADQGVMRMKRTWHITKTNAASLDLKLAFRLTDAGIGLLDASARPKKYKLLRSLDGGSTWVEVDVGLTQNGQEFTCTLPAATFAEGQYTVGVDVGKGFVITFR